MRDAILHLFPGAILGRDFTLRDDGEGPYIDKWELAAPKPTAPELLQAGLIARCASLCRAIDDAADAARVAVVGAPLRDEEYKLAAAEAQAFKDAGYPAWNIPRSVSAWAIQGRTPQQAADNILSEARRYNEALYAIRETRLQAKGLVRKAMADGHPALALDIADETVASIRAAITGIGNNAS